MTYNYYLPIWGGMALSVAVLLLFFTWLKWLDIRRIRQDASQIAEIQKKRQSIFDTPKPDLMTRAFFRSFPMPVLLVDELGVIINVNAAARDEYSRYRYKHIHTVFPTMYELIEGVNSLHKDEGGGIVTVIKIKCVRSSGEEIEGRAIIVGELDFGSV